MSSQRSESSPTGYSDPAYAASLAELGTPQRLARSAGTILVRPVPGTEYIDATGPYPLFACSHWDRLAADVDELRGDLVSVVLVPDPFGTWTTAQLEACFPDHCVPFKEHFVVDLSRAPLQSASRHHRRDAARALRRSSVTLVQDAAAFLDEWEGLYCGLVERHGIRGPAAFSRASFAKQFCVPGLVAFRAEQEGVALGAALWLVDRGVAYYHLAATTVRGHGQGVSYALVATALEHFAAGGLEWAALGAGTGLNARDDGLSRFKAGWATGTRTAFVCGRILDEPRYRELTAGLRTTFFPAYRAGEHGDMSRAPR